MTVLVSAVFAGCALAILIALPRPGWSRLAAVVPLPAGAVLRHAGSRGAGIGPSAPRSHPLVAGAVIAVVAGAVAGAPLGLLVMVFTTVVLRALTRRTRLVAAREERARAVEACLAVAGELRAGRSSAEALRAAADVAVGPAGAALAQAARTADLGGDVAGALTSVDGSAVPELLRALGACWRVCASAGNGLAPAVERLADGMVADAERRRSVEAELAGPRATAGLLALLPIAGVLLAAGLGADPWHVLFHTSLGVACLLTGVGLDLLGLWWTTVLADRALLA